MSSLRLQEMLAESGLAAEEMTDVVDLLAPLGTDLDDAPSPSAELAALFGPTDPAPVTRLTGRRSAVAGALVLALSGVAATGLSAAANTLPSPLQHKLAQFSHHYLPFDLPEPPPSPERPVIGHRAVEPAPERAGESASRSFPGREGTATGLPDGPGAGPQSSVVPQPTASPQASQSAGPMTAQPSTAPDWTDESVPPSPLAQAPGSTSSGTPTDRPASHGKGHQDSPGKGTGPGTGAGQGQTQDPGNGSTHKPGDQGGGNGNGNGNGGAPAPAAPVPPAPLPPAPQPDPPAPTLPLPDPLPDLPLPGADAILGGN